MFPASKEESVLRLIYKACGSPSEKSWPGVTRLRHWAELCPLGEKPRVLREVFSDRELYPLLDDSGVDLIDKLLSLNPTTRLSAKEALKHPYFTTDPLPCDPSEMPWIDVEVKEHMVRK